MDYRDNNSLEVIKKDLIETGLFKKDEDKRIDKLTKAIQSAIVIMNSSGHNYTHHDFIQFLFQRNH
jgi:hypothetical protein